MGKDIKITERSSEESGAHAVVDTVMRLGSLGFFGLPESETKYDAEVNGKHIGTYSSADEAYKAASKK